MWQPWLACTCLTQPACSPLFVGVPHHSRSFAKAWRDASDSIGYPICVTVTFWDNGVLVNATQVHAGGETPGGGGGGSGGGISPPVINPPVITFGDAN